MKTYSNVIALTKNARGIYSIDPTAGCYSGTKNNKLGCYNDCYAARIAKIYGYNFSKTVIKNFTSQKHLDKIKREISKVKMPFIRMGTMGDPSEDWEHTILICEKIQSNIQLDIFKEDSRKEIVIITKHWTVLTDDQLKRISKLKICINTSVSAIDDKSQLDLCLNEYERIKPYCKSILRVVSFDFNTDSNDGKTFSEIQAQIFNKYEVLDTVFRSSKNNQLVKSGVINIHKTKFLGKKTYVSKFNKKTYFGNCKNCLEMCGVNM
jgi:hypothetical protein